MRALHGQKNCAEVLHAMTPVARLLTAAYLWPHEPGRNAGDPARWRPFTAQGRAEGAMSSLPDRPDPSERFVLPDSQGSAADPVEGNPFPIHDPFHAV